MSDDVESVKMYREHKLGAPRKTFRMLCRSINVRRRAHLEEKLRKIAVALRNFLLAAYAEGLGGVWTDGILAKEPEINALLGIEGKKLVAVVPLGCPNETPRVPPRRSGRLQWVGFE